MHNHCISAECVINRGLREENTPCVVTLQMVFFLNGPVCAAVLSVYGKSERGCVLVSEGIRW